MRAIYWILLSYVCVYVAAHIENKTRTQREISGFMFLISLLSLIVSVVFAVLGK